MTMAVALHSQAADRSARTGAGRIATVDVFTSLARAEEVWHSLEAAGGWMTPYQRFEFQDAWQRHVGERIGSKPFIVVARDANQQPLLVLPLGVQTQHGVRIARFPGGKHVTFNMALWRQDFAASADQADLDELLRLLRAHSDRPDVLALTRQPHRWRDLKNPMALWPHQDSTNDCPVMTIVPGEPPANRISNSFRRRLKGKERKLQSLPGYAYTIAADDVSITRVLDAFFAIKPLRMAEQKLPNVFADPGVESFIREACMRRVAGGRAIEIHALQCEEEVIALFAGVADGNRFSMMFNTYTLSANAKFSPGLILMRDIVDHYAERGYTSLDLGIGSDDYKRLFCKTDEAIFDSYLPLTARGSLAAVAMSSLGRAKRVIKHTPAMMRMAQWLRSAIR